MASDLDVELYDWSVSKWDNAVEFGLWSWSLHWKHFFCQFYL